MVTPHVMTFAVIDVGPNRLKLDQEQHKKEMEVKCGRVPSWKRHFCLENQGQDGLQPWSQGWHENRVTQQRCDAPRQSMR